MHWNSLSEFIRMGGYGKYVWGSYAVTFFLLALEIIMLSTRRRLLAAAGRLRKPKDWD